MGYKLNPYKRYQNGLTISDLFPTPSHGTCACGCGRELTGRKKRWFSKDCMKVAVRQFYIVKGDIPIIRDELFKIDKGHCHICGKYDPNWQADHIKAVVEGGGACGIDNFQTLCTECHKRKTALLYSAPNGRNIFAGRFNVFKPLNGGWWARNGAIPKNIKRDTTFIFNRKAIRNRNII